MVAPDGTVNPAIGGWSEANLNDAYLSDAVLSNAKGITNEQLEKTPGLLLEGATMPNGQKHEEWFKSKDRGEDGQNSAS